MQYHKLVEIILQIHQDIFFSFNKQSPHHYHKIYPNSLLLLSRLKVLVVFTDVCSKSRVVFIHIQIALPRLRNSTRLSVYIPYTRSSIIGNNELRDAMLDFFSIFVFIFYSVFLFPFFLLLIVSKHTTRHTDTRDTWQPCRDDRVYVCEHAITQRKRFSRHPPFSV